MASGKGRNRGFRVLEIDARTCGVQGGLRMFIHEAWKIDSGRPYRSETTIFKDITSNQTRIYLQHIS